MHHEKDEVGSKAGLLSRRRTCTVIDRAGAIYGSRQIAKRTGTGRTWLSMLCALRPSVAPLSLSLSPSLPLVSTINVTTRYPRADNENIRGLLSSSFSFLLFFFSQEEEIRRYSCREAYSEVEKGGGQRPKVVKGGRL